MAGAPGGAAGANNHANAYGSEDPAVEPHAEYLALGRTRAQREANYRESFREAISDDQLGEIRAHVQQQRMGSASLSGAIVVELQWITTTRPRGRPKRLFFWDEPLRMRHLATGKSPVNY
jgi:putative transposase